jgi:hypothetical protein
VLASSIFVVQAIGQKACFSQRLSPKAVQFSTVVGDV